jgi:Ca-activated chloride channel family protein
VIFSGTSFLLCPLTLDAVAANLFLDAVSPDVLPDPGTNLEEAIQGALGAFGEETTGRGRAIILFTDGESHAGDAMAAAGVCGERGIPVITVGVGTPSGEPIPIRDRTGKRVGYKKDRASEVVLSRLDEATLREVARVSGGEYFPATLQGHEVEEMIAWLHRLEKGELGGAFRRRVEERFQIPLGIGLVLLVLALITPEARRRETA